MNDAQLLQEYVREGSDLAFTRIVEKHVNLVYSAAVRLTRDSHLAEEVTQQVFILFARKARGLGSATIVPAWLYRSARLVASEVIRREFRFRRRERLAVENMARSPHEPAWEEIEAVLDEAMAGLSRENQEAIVLRYFENRSLRETGAALGISEDAAQKRVSRALEQLRKNLTRRGVAVASSAAVGGALSVGAIQAAPAGLTLSVKAAALAAATGVGINFVTLMASTKIKVMAGAALLVTLTVSLVILYNENSKLRRRLGEMQTSAGVEGRANNAPSTATEVDPGELRRLRKAHLELLSLRDRVTRMRKEGQQKGIEEGANAKSNAEQSDPGSLLLSAALTNQVSEGHTLVVGGWSREGLRGYLLLTPMKRAAGEGEEEELTVQSQVVYAPESFWNEIGWGSYKSEARRSALAGVLTGEHIQALVKVLQETGEAEISNTSSPRGRNGERMSLGFSISNDEGSGAVMAVDFIPRIANDGSSFELELFPTPVPGNAEVHSSLKKRMEESPTPTP